MQAALCHPSTKQSSQGLEVVNHEISQGASCGNFLIKCGPKGRGLCQEIGKMRLLKMKIYFLKGVGVNFGWGRSQVVHLLLKLHVF